MYDSWMKEKFAIVTLFISLLFSMVIFEFLHERCSVGDVVVLILCFVVFDTLDKCGQCAGIPP